MKTTRLEQKKTLHREWKFECICEGESYVFRKTIDNIDIIWNITHQVGSYVIDGGDMSFIYDWETLEDLMEQIL